jgi:hypothetical protein
MLPIYRLIAVAWIFVLGAYLTAAAQTEPTAVQAAQEAAQTEQEAEISARFTPALNKLGDLQKKVKDIHPLLGKLYPVAVVEEDVFYVFDTGEKEEGYSLVISARPAMIVPQGIRAAFPLNFYDNKTACVVTGEVFDDPAGYATIFHEFIHCAQMDTCEPKLKAGLQVARQAQAKNDFSWELNHPFPYQDEQYEEIYGLLLESAAAGDRPAVSRCRAFLREVLNVEDFEYMVWQEWKEGFARYIENLVRESLGLEKHSGSDEPPFDRVTFYEGGARLIELLVSEESEITNDIEMLFWRLARI